MTNLIPPESKKQLVFLYRVRLFSAWAILWSATLLIGALLMYPTYLLISGTSAAYAETVAGVTERTEAYDSMVAELQTTSQEAQMIIRSANASKLSELLTDIWSVNGQGVTISAVRMIRSEEGIQPISITGEAENRRALASLRNRIESLSYVAEVNLPIESLAQNQDISYTITVTINSDNL